MRLLIIILLSFGCITSCAVLLHNKTPLECFNDAKHFEAEGDINKAVNSLTKAIKDQPNYYDAYIYRAELNTRRDSFDRAAEDYTAILTSPSYTLNVAQKGELLNRRGNAYYSSAKNDSAACADWNISCEQYGHTGACKNKRDNCKKK